MCTGAYRGEGYHAPCIHTHLRYLFYVFVLCCLVLFIEIKKDAFVPNGYFSPMRSISIVIKQAFFCFKLFFRINTSHKRF